jgi:type I restriction enzyme S subunit
LRRIFRIINGGTPTSEPENWEGDIAWATPLDVGRAHGGRIVKTQRTITTDGLRTGSAAVPPGSLIVSTRAPIGYVAETTTRLAFNQGCRGLVPRTPVDIRYFRYQLLAFGARLQALGQGSTFVELSTDDLAGFALLNPPLAQQRAIADYLDAETARIDGLVDALRTANRAVAEWLVASTEAVVWGRVDATAPLMRLTLDERQIQYGIVLPGPDVEDGVPIVKGGNLLSGVLTADGLAKTTRELEAGYARSRLRANDIAFAIRGAVGACALVPPEVEDANITQDVALVAPRRNIDPTWLLYALRSPSVQAQAEARVLGATIRGINIRDLKRLRVPVLSLRDQRERAAELRRLQDRHDRLTSARARQIELLLERRQALITAAVTGQLEIPGVAA